MTLKCSVNIVVSNLVLLGKWEWRICNETKKNSLFFKVLSSKYWELKNKVNKVGRHCSTRWRDFQSIEKGCGASNQAGLLKNHLGKQVMVKKLFFLDRFWLEGRIMKNMYPCLFLLVKNNDIALKGLMYVLGGIGREMVIR